jgi:hypothetical protein
MPHQTFNDGNALYGAREININTTTFVFESFEQTFSSQELVQYDHLGRPIKQVIIPQVGTATGVCALKSGGNFGPFIGDYTNAVENVIWIVTEVGKPETKDGIKMVNVSFRQKLN